MSRPSAPDQVDDVESEEIPLSHEPPTSGPFTLAEWIQRDEYDNSISNPVSSPPRHSAEHWQRIHESLTHRSRPLPIRIRPSSLPLPMASTSSPDVPSPSDELQEENNALADSQLPSPKHPSPAHDLKPSSPVLHAHDDSRSTSRTSSRSETSQERFEREKAAVTNVIAGLDKDGEASEETLRLVEELQRIAGEDEDGSGSGGRSKAFANDGSDDGNDDDDVDDDDDAASVGSNKLDLQPETTEASIEHDSAVVSPTANPTNSTTPTTFGKHKRHLSDHSIPAPQQRAQSLHSANISPPHQQTRPTWGNYSTTTHSGFSPDQSPPLPPKLEEPKATNPNKTNNTKKKNKLKPTRLASFLDRLIYRLGLLASLLLLFTLLHPLLPASFPVPFLALSPPTAPPAPPAPPPPPPPPPNDLSTHALLPGVSSARNDTVKLALHLTGLVARHRAFLGVHHGGGPFNETDKPENLHARQMEGLGEMECWIEGMVRLVGPSSSSSSGSDDGGVDLEGEKLRARMVRAAGGLSVGGREGREWAVGNGVNRFVEEYLRGINGWEM
ncbi:unnamed protein product [Zymoseptoria tritici ST99CH_3D1]|nr:unnamed protein product [Zymoseptoria tritici ST99CH_3D1]